MWVCYIFTLWRYSLCIFLAFLFCIAIPHFENIEIIVNSEIKENIRYKSISEKCIMACVFQT